MTYDDWKCTDPRDAEPCNEREEEPEEPQCTTWDATTGTRCTVDGCTHDGGEAWLCPCHAVYK